MAPKVKGLLERLDANEPVIVAEGYLFEFEQRGYLQAGSYVPEVVIEHPELVKQLYEEFVHAGSDVVEAFTYYAHREKMRLIGREGDLERINRKALQMARQVADETGTLMAGNICNTTIYGPSESARKAVREIFTEQVRWAVEEGADFIIGETFEFIDEALLALEVIKSCAKGLPAVITFAAFASGQCGDGVALSEAARRLHEAGADVVGVNCHRGPATIVPLMREMRQVCKGRLACLPVPFRTTEQEKSFAVLRDPVTGTKCFPDELDQMIIPRRDVTTFVQELQELGVHYMGLCCGNRAFYVRKMAEALGRHPPASKYSPDMSKHYTNLKDEMHKTAGSAYFSNSPIDN